MESGSSCLCTLAVVSLMAGCAAPVPKRAAPPPTAAAVAKEPAPPSARSALLATPARLMLITDAPIPLAEFERRAPVNRVEGGALAYIDDTGSRALATIAETRRIPGPEKLEDVCVADDGKTTFATSDAPGDEVKLWRAERFDAPLTLFATMASRVTTVSGSKKWSFIARNDEGTWLVDCAHARIERITGRVRAVNYPFWSEKVQVLRLTPERPGPDYCVVRPSNREKFSEHPNCWAHRRKDGWFSVEQQPPERPATSKNYKPPPPKCLVLVDPTGKEQPCGTPEGPEEKYVPRVVLEAAPLKSARFYAKDLAVVPSPEHGGLFRLGPGAIIDRERRIGPESLGHCAPLLAVEPVFTCQGDPTFDLVVRVAPDGALVEELRRPRPPSEDQGQRQRPRFHHTVDGGLAVGGDCAGALSDAACLRTGDGRWRSLAFSPELVTALGRTAPVTRLIPTADGRLYVGTGTAEGGTFGRESLSLVKILLFRADRGEAISFPKLPFWILEALSRLKDAPDASSSGTGPDLSFGGSNRIRAWPLKRDHPAFGTTEHCRLDVVFDGTFETHCVQGRLFASGAFGLLQKRLHEVYETVDAGGTWTKVPLPKGLETDDIECTPLGCRIGPYFRAGWGEAGSTGVATP